MYDTETDFPDAPDEGEGAYKLDAGPFGYSGQQIDFLTADLGSVDRRITPWVIVAGHRPVCCQSCSLVLALFQCRRNLL